MSASKHGGRLGNVSRGRERSAELLRPNGEGVVETDGNGQSLRHVGERKCVNMVGGER